MSRVALVVGALACLGVILVCLQAVFGRLSVSQGVDVATGIVAISSFGLVWRWLPLSGGTFLALGLLCSIAAGLLVSWVAGRWNWSVPAIKWMLYVMALAPMIPLVLASVPAQASESARPVVVIFVDGYVAPSFLEKWGVDAPGELFTMLESQGFATNEASASYSMTYASLASALQADYVATEKDVVDGDFRRRMYRLLQGESDFVGELRNSGYTYVHVESGWTGTRCGADVDECVPAPVLEETLWNLLQRTALRALVVEQFGHAFTIGGNATLNWLADLADLPSERTLVISHSLLPHPPLFLNESCEPDYSPYAMSANVWEPAMGESRRSDRIDQYAAQIRCVNTRLAEVVANPTFEDAVVAIVGDHGSDSQGQLWTPVKEWTPAMIEERMATIVAVRGCGETVPSATVDSLAFVLSCVMGNEFNSLEPRTYLVPTEEVTPGADLLRLP